MRAARDSPGLVRRAVLGGLAAVVVLVIVLVATGGSSGHQVSMTVPQATGLIPGFDVRMNGVEVGSVKSVDLTRDYKAHVVLDLGDKAWPLPRDTRFRTRLGGTIHYSDRYVEVDRGKSPQMLSDGQTLPASSYVDPVEFDTVFNTFGPRTRSDLRSTIDHGADVAPGVAKNLPYGLEHGPDASASAESILRQLGDDPKALDTLVRSTASVAGSVAAADPGLGELVQTAGTTFQALGDRSRQLEDTIAQAPATLRAARGTASRVDETLTRAQDLTTALSPGVERLRAVSHPLDHLLKTVVDVAPDAKATLSTLDRAAPQLDSLVDKARDPLMGQVRSIGQEGAKQLDCIRPYAPEIAGLAVNWAGIWGAAGDATDKLFRAQVGAVPFPNEEIASSGQLSSLLPPGALRMAFPRPPGQLVDKPWFQPQCGITKDSIDITKDPEATNFDPMSKKLVDIDPSGANQDGGRK